MEGQSKSKPPEVADSNTESIGPRDFSSKPAQRRLLIPLAVVLLLLIGGFSAALLQLQHDRLEQSSQEKMISASFALEEGLAKQAHHLSALAEIILDNAGLEEAVKVQDRDRLQAEYGSLYRQLRKEHSITHLYFHGADRVNLLRLHQPNMNGDLINRFTAREAERTGGTASGIEMGPLGTLTLRVVRPIRDGDTIVGYLELGKEIEDILAGIHDNHGVELAVVIDKAALTQQNWEAGMMMLGREGDWNRFPHEAVIYTSFPSFPRECDRFVAEARHRHGEVDTEMQFRGRTWRIFVVSLKV